MRDNHCICFDHEEWFRIKYLQFKRGLDVTIGFQQKGPKQNMALSCAICQTSDHVRYYQVRSIQTLSLKNYIISEMQQEGKKLTGKGSGITENGNFSSKCYGNV